MACNSCSKSFTLLRKEKGCPGCGFSFCSSCLNNKVFLSKFNAETKVCSKCKRSSENNEKKETFAAPDAYYKRLAEAEEKSKNHKIQERLQNLKRDKENNKSNVATDEDIARRLQSIKGETQSVTTKELQDRLAKLRGLPSMSCESKTTLPPPDNRTEQEQADDLMKQYMEQTKIDTKYKNEFDDIMNDIESRVKKLKDTSGPSVQNVPQSQDQLDSEDDDEAFKKIIEKVKAQSLLEFNDNTSSKHDELPFCEICNEDAQMRCLGCQYLFCQQCFMEHKDDDDGCNQYEPYKPPQNC